MESRIASLVEANILVEYTNEQEFAEVVVSKQG
jgi:hypothetical protein